MIHKIIVIHYWQFLHVRTLTQCLLNECYITAVFSERPEQGKARLYILTVTVHYVLEEGVPHRP